MSVPTFCVCSYSPFHVFFTSCFLAHTIKREWFYSTFSNWMFYVLPLKWRSSSILIPIAFEKRDKQSDSLLKLVQYHGFLPTYNNVTQSWWSTRPYLHQQRHHQHFIHFNRTTALFRSFCYNIIHPLWAAAINYFLN